MFCLYNLDLPASPESSPPLMPITPTLHHPGNLSDATADLNWSTPLSLDMPGCDSSPTDFAFAAPTIDSPFDKTPSYSTPNTYSNFNIPGYGYSSASPFSSTSGSTTGSSFSSADALPAISRDFVRPSPTQTRRPATAGAALQSRSPFVGFMAEGDRFQRQNRSSTVSADGKIPETIDEGEGVFANPNPFASSSEDDKQAQAHVDSHFNPSHRRASEPQFGEAHWSSFTSPVNPYLNAGQMNFSMNPHMQQLQRSMPEPARPQTHHGLPSSSSMVSLPSARTIVNQIDGFAAPPNVDAKPEDKTMQPSTLMPFRDTMSMGTQRAYSIDSSKTTRPSQHNRSAKSETDSDITFFPLGGPAPKKRPRRRFDEIERLYACGWNGCEKAYGTLNHLNAHVAMQKHGEKRLPSQFKDMRKAWRKKKLEQTAATANGQFSTSWSQRPSIGSSSDSDFDRRESTMTMMSDRSSIPYTTTYGYESRPTTSSSIASSTDGRPYSPSQYSHHVLNAVPAAGRRPSAPGQLLMPQQQQHPQGFRPSDGDYPTPTQQNPFPTAGRQQFPFQMLTSPMPIPAGGQQQFEAHFAFQR